MEEEKNNVENSAEPTVDQAADLQSSDDQAADSQPSDDRAADLQLSVDQAADPQPSDDQAADLQLSDVVSPQPDEPLSGRELRRQKKEAAAAQKAEAAAQKAREKEESLAVKLQRRQEKKEYRQGVRQERGQEIKLLWHIVEFVMLVTFIVLAIDQAGLYGFLFVWFFIALAAASIVLLLAGLIRVFRKKRAGIMILVSLIGIIGCIAWFIFLVSSKLI